MNAGKWLSRALAIAGLVLEVVKALRRPVPFPTELQSGEAYVLVEPERGEEHPGIRSKT